MDFLRFDNIGKYLLIKIIFTYKYKILKVGNITC